MKSFPLLLTLISMSTQADVVGRIDTVDPIQGIVVIDGVATPLSPKLKGNIDLRPGQTVVFEERDGVIVEIRPYSPDFDDMMPDAEIKIPDMRRVPQ